MSFYVSIKTWTEGRGYYFVAYYGWQEMSVFVRLHHSQYFHVLRVSAQAVFGLGWFSLAVLRCVVPNFLA